MSKLEALAREVVRRWDKGDLAEAVRALSDELELQDKLREKHKATLEAGWEWNDLDGVEVDDEPIVSEVYDPDDDTLVGIWVEAWVWVESRKE